LDRNQILREIRQVDGEWHRPNRFKSFKNVPEDKTGQIDDGPDESKASATTLKGFTVAGDSVAWQQGSIIWSCSYNAEAPVKIWDATTNELIEFTYASKDQEYLLRCKDQNGEFLAGLIPGRGQFPARFSELNRISSAFPVTNIIPVNGIDGFAFQTRNEAGQPAFFIKDNATAQPTIQPWSNIKASSANEKHLYVVGTRFMTNDIVGIWQYGLISHVLDCAVPNQELDLGISHYDRSAPISLTNASGDKISYGQKPPTAFSLAKKYPAVIGEGWAGYQVAVNSGGAFFANVSRDDRTPAQWAVDIMAVYDDVIKNPNVDTNNIYLLGISAGASTVNWLIEQKPTLWRGAILFSPLDFPDLSRTHASKILIDTGGTDNDLGDTGRIRLVQFQDAALNAGVQVVVVSHTDAGHVYRSIRSERERVEGLVKFLFEL
jgi:hypothetical protein